MHQLCLYFLGPEVSPAFKEEEALIIPALKNGKVCKKIAWRWERGKSHGNLAGPLPSKQKPHCKLELKASLSQRY